MQPDNKAIYDANWDKWSDQKIYGPASRFIKWLIQQNLEYADRAAIAQVIDVGCGQGETTAMLARMLPGAAVLGIDFSDTGIEVARRLYRIPNLSFDLDTESRHLVSAACDLTTAFEVLEHVEDWQLVLGKMCAASRRYVMLSFPTGRMRPYEPTVGHLRNFRKGEVEAFMQKNGFASRNLFYAGFPFYSPLYREFCNLLNAGTNSFAEGTYGPSQKIVANVIYVMFRYFSFSRIGDQFCGLFERQ